MNGRILSKEQITAFRENLYKEEKSEVSIEKYVRDAGTFYQFADGQQITKELTIAFKNSLIDRGYAVRSINSMLASLNSLLRFLGWTDCKTKNLYCQRQTFKSQQYMDTDEAAV